MAADLATTRRCLHAIAEQVMAGPQHRRSNEIALRITNEGFATVAEPGLELTATVLVSTAGEFALDGASCACLAAAVGVDVGAPRDLYHDLTGVPADEILTVTPSAARELLEALRRGDAALRRLEPTQTPILWPEHFDVGITADEVNYGVSPGDGYLDEPYVYVGPWKPRVGEFWNAPFGAARPLRELPDDALDDFLAHGRELTR
ncbi:MAG TPA: hypothetical protein VHV82_06080 [Sporichthyaceae bacterium]|jgi:hypothetical protein|nr:hypothetical protein [Sporichthyaceae bacterium]